MATKREVTEYLKAEAGDHKSALIRILNQMESDGLKREAERLSSIIGRLEYWQNSG